MAEELSPESKLYVKEEIEKARRGFKEEVEKAKSKATKTFSTVAIVVGLLTGLGVYGGAKTYIDNAISEGLNDKGFTDLMTDATNYAEKAKGFMADANNSYINITDIEAQAKDTLSKLGLFELLEDPNGYAWVGDIMFVWGTHQKSFHEFFQPFRKFHHSFPNNCFAVITEENGQVYNKTKVGYAVKSDEKSSIFLPGMKLREKKFSYVAIGN
jgi:hypothetical protein